MAEKTKKKDFIELEYTGIISESKTIFDTTDADIAKQNNIFSERYVYGPITICIGEGQLVPGLDKALEEKEIGKEYEIELNPEEAFGKKDVKLIKLVPTKVFTNQKISPFPGLNINIDGMFGTIKAVTGGRTIVDFNHPLAGKKISYKFRILRVLKDDKEKIEKFLSSILNLKRDIFSVDVKNQEAEITLKMDLPEEIQTTIRKKIEELIPTVKKITFLVKKEDKKETNQ